MDKLTIVLADDHPLLLMGVRELLEKDLNFIINAAVAGPSALVEEVRRLAPNIIVTDYSMPGDETYGDGIRLVKYLIRHFPKTQILVLTMVSNPMIISALYDAGVRAVVSKSGDLEEILTALYSLRQGRVYYPPGFQKGIYKDESTKLIAERINSLTPRQFEVLRHFVRGQSVMQIAAILHRSVKTVSGQKIAAMRKLNVKTDQELVTFSVENEIFL